MKTRIHRVVHGVHMGLGHVGLAKLLKKAGVDVLKLEPGELVMCLNKHGDKMKVLGCKGLVLGYLRMQHNQRIMHDALQFIPQTFGGGNFNYDAAVKKALTQRLAEYPVPKPKVSPLDAARAAKSA